MCPTFGWEPRRSHGRWQDSIDQWTRNVDAFERDNTHLGAADILAQWAALYEAGGVMNQAANEHISDNLESHKVADVNDLLRKIGWEPTDEDREYTVRVRVTRPVTYQETGYAYVTVTARDEEDAADIASNDYSSRDLARMVDDWDTDFDYPDTGSDYDAEAEWDDMQVTEN